MPTTVPNDDYTFWRPPWRPRLIRAAGTLLRAAVLIMRAREMSTPLSSVEVYASLLITDNIIQRQVRGLWVGVELMELAELGADKFRMGYGISNDY